MEALGLGRAGEGQQGARRWWLWLLPILVVAVAFFVTIVLGLFQHASAALTQLNTELFHDVNGLSCSVPASSPIYQLMWTGFNQPIVDYVLLYGTTVLYVLIKKRDQWPALIVVGLLIAGLGYLSNIVIWHWIFGPRPFVVTSACIKYPEWEPEWSKFSSYPSGHARETASEITYMVTFWRRIWPLALLYLILLDFSRMYIGVHFPFDVLMGSALGWSIAQASFMAYNIYLAPWLQEHWPARFKPSQVARTA